MDLIGKKNLVRLIIVILVVVIVGGLFIFVVYKRSRGQTTTNFSQRNTPIPTRAQSTAEIINQSKTTNGLRQFVSQKYNFSFSYPADWQILDEPNVNGIEIQKIDKLGAGFSISVRVLDNPQKLSVEEFAKNQAYPAANGANDLPQKVIVGNVTGYKLSHLPPGLLADIYLPYRYKEGGILDIFAGGEFEKTAKTIDFYNQIISSFLTSFKVF